MAQHKRGMARTQTALLPPAVEDYVGAHALVRVIDQYVISDDRARAIEKKLKLPAGWMDRDNTRLTSKLSADDFALVQKVVAVDASVKAAVSKLLDQNRK